MSVASPFDCPPVFDCPPLFLFAKLAISFLGSSTRLGALVAPCCFHVLPCAWLLRARATVESHCLCGAPLIRPAPCIAPCIAVQRMGVHWHRWCVATVRAVLVVVAAARAATACLPGRCGAACDTPCPVVVGGTLGVSLVGMVLNDLSSERNAQSAVVFQGDLVVGWGNGAVGRWKGERVAFAFMRKQQQRQRRVCVRRHARHRWDLRHGGQHNGRQCRRVEWNRVVAAGQRPQRVGRVFCPGGRHARCRRHVFEQRRLGRAGPHCCVGRRPVDRVAERRERPGARPRRLWGASVRRRSIFSDGRRSTPSQQCRRLGRQRLGRPRRRQCRRARLRPGRIFLRPLDRRWSIFGGGRRFG